MARGPLANAFLYLSISALLVLTVVFFSPSSPSSPSVLQQREVKHFYPNKPKQGSPLIMSRVGGLGEARALTEEDVAVLNSAKAAIEEKAGSSFDTFEGVQVATQVVAGTNFFFKINVGDSHVHARVFRSLSQDIEVAGVQTGKSAEDALEYF